MEYVQLVGTEAVERAASRMREAAAEVDRAANLMSEAVDRLVRALQDFQNWYDNKDLLHRR